MKERKPRTHLMPDHPPVTFFEPTSTISSLYLSFRNWYNILVCPPTALHVSMSAYGQTDICLKASGRKREICQLKRQTKAMRLLIPPSEKLANQLALIVHATPSNTAYDTIAPEGSVKI